MTLPSLIGRYQEKATVIQLKKVYSILNQAYLRVISEEGTLDTWGLTVSEQGDMTILNKFAKYLNTLQICGKEQGCFYNGQYIDLAGIKRYNHDTANIYANLVLYDGTSVQFRLMFPDCFSNQYGVKSMCGTIVVDINGKKKPNQYGRDMFRFLITKDRIAPAGMQGTTNSTSFENSCIKNGDLYGINCTAWVLFNENMDYLHCNDLSWNGKRSCKE